jgi:hypothetical protein
MKTEIKHIKKALLIFWDSEQKQYRRVVFGDPKELIDMLIINGEILLPRLQQLAKKDYNSPDELKNEIKDSREGWEKDNYSTAGENMELELSYEVIDLWSRNN